MRFLFFAAQYLPTAGGVERYTHSLCKTLIRMGHACSVVTSALPGLPSRETSEKIEIFRLPSYMLMGGRFPVIKKDETFNRAADEIFETDFDFAVINTRFYPLSLYAANQCRRRGLPAIVVEHGTKHLSLGFPVLDWLGNLYEHAAMKYVRGKQTRFFGVSLACNRWLRHFHVEAEGVLYNAADSDAVIAAAKTSEYDAKKIFNIDAEDSLIVFCGRFIREKGLGELLLAFSRYRETHPRSALILAGDGPLFDEIKSAGHAKVYLAGLLPYKDSLALISQADVFVLPSYSEGFSSVILEAAALGRCIITTPTGGSAELIQNLKSGILLDGVSPSSIERALAYALTNESFRESSGRLARAITAERFSWAKTAEALVEAASKKHQGPGKFRI